MIKSITDVDKTTDEGKLLAAAVGLIITNSKGGYREFGDVTKVLYDLYAKAEKAVEEWDNMEEEKRLSEEKIEEIAGNLANPNACKTDNWVEGFRFGLNYNKPIK